MDKTLMPAGMSFFSDLDRAEDGIPRCKKEDMAIHWGLQRTSTTIAEKGEQIARYGRG